MKVYLVGAGMGGMSTLTEEAKDAISKADIIIGAKRLLVLAGNKPAHEAYKSDEIAEYLKEQNIDTVAVLLSGDVGFYSGAKRLVEALKDYDVELVAGVSVINYFCARLKMSYEDTKLVSLHGTDRMSEAIMTIVDNNKTLILTGGTDDIRELCRRIIAYELHHITLYIGERLSYFNEKITVLKPEEAISRSFDKLTCVLAVNSMCFSLGTGFISDEQFIRGDVPMTKQEIRIMSIAKLGLKADSVMYDVGAGTGSISIEAAIKAPKGKVYAIERNEPALKLIKANKQRFTADNIEIIEGEAPDVLDALPDPTHVFIGGSGGKLVEILKCVLEKNSEARVVINVISLDTLTKLLAFLDEEAYFADITCINAANQRTRGQCRLMTAQNPVYVVSIN